MTAFLGSLFFIALAEMGDKTQLVALAFATRFRAWTVLWGIFVATLVVHLFSVVIGEVLGVNLDPFYIQLIAGISFIGFGIWTLRGDELDDADKKAERFSPFWTVAIAFFIAELGDKTMLATVTLAAEYQSFIPVWLGSSLGMVVADALAIVVGILLGKKLPEKLIKWVSASIFIGFGAIALIELFWK
ncbi:MAG: TMEM165/GDT1 family protein [Clostridia bacterium]|nr:TMEM165/GDT1 family protein [Clostridia bacterium]